MILKEFLSDAIRIKETLLAHKDLLDYISEVTSYYERYIQLCQNLRDSFTGSSNVTQQKMTPVVNEITALDKAVIKEIGKYEPFNLFTNFQSLISSFKEIEIFSKNSDKSIEEEIKTLINLQTKAFSEKKFNEIFSFVSFCYPFQNKLDRYSFTADIFLENLDLKQISLPAKNELIDIQIISTDNNLEVFSSFLSFIDDLYQNLSKAFVIHYSEYPLNIIKIESGSIWSKLFGHEKFENKVIKAGLVIDLIDKAKKNGLDEKNQVLLEKVFNQSIVDIAKIIPKSTTEIIVDDNRLLNLEKKQIKAIEGKNPLMLNIKNDKNTNA